MVLSTSYLGFTLPHPLIAGAGPMATSVENSEKLAQGGAAAIVLQSIFQEQFDENESPGARDPIAGKTATKTFRFKPDEYLENLRRIKGAVDIPIIASINGYTPGKWLQYVSDLRAAGADALELNIYHVVRGAEEPAETIERRARDLVREICAMTEMPVAVKLTPYYTALGHFCHMLEDVGAHGLVLFNRFFDIDIDTMRMQVFTHRALSDSRELLLRLRWLSILTDSLQKTDLAVSGGVHTAVDAVKAVMCGAAAVQMVSAPLKFGMAHFSTIRKRMEEWMEERGFHSLGELRDRMRVIDPRTQYLQLLQAWEWA